MANAVYNDDTPHERVAKYNAIEALLKANSYFSSQTKILVFDDQYFDVRYARLKPAVDLNISSLIQFSDYVS